MHAGAMFADGTLIGIGDAYNPNTDSDDFALTRYLLADPSWIAGMVTSLPTGAFGTGGQGSVLAALNTAQSAVVSGDAASALTALTGLRAHIDGCGAGADGDDWIVSCNEQLQVRRLVDQVIAKLSAP